MSYKFWLTTDVKFLRSNIKTMPPSQIAEHLGRTKLSVVSKAYELGIQPNKPMRRWSPEDLQLVQTLPPDEAAAKTGRSLQSILMKLSRLKSA